jgi:hypothetical protein
MKINNRNITVDPLFKNYKNTLHLFIDRKLFLNVSNSGLKVKYVIVTVGSFRALRTCAHSVMGPIAKKKNLQMRQIISDILTREAWGNIGQL